MIETVTSWLTFVIVAVRTVWQLRLGRFRNAPLARCGKSGLDKGPDSAMLLPASWLGGWFPKWAAHDEILIIQ